MAKIFITEIIEQVRSAAKVAGRGRLDFQRNVLLRMVGADLYIQASDGSLEYEARLVLPEPVPDELRFGVNGTLFAGLLGRMGQGEVDLSLGQGQVCLRQGRRKFDLAVMDKYWEHDLEPFPEQGGSFFVSGRELAAIVSDVEFCAMTDETMSGLASVLIADNGDDRAAAVALNGHQMAVRRFAVQGVVSALPEMGLKIRRALWPDVRSWMDGREIEAALDAKRLHLRDASRTERWSLALTLSEYPDWQELLKRHSPDTTIIVQRQAMMDALERLRFFTSDSVISARWTMDDQIVTMRVESEGAGRGEDYVGITKDGPLEKIMLPINDLLGILKHFQGSDVELSFSGDHGPCIIRDKEVDDYLVLIMPMKVSDELETSDE